MWEIFSEVEYFIPYIGYMEMSEIKYFSLRGLYMRENRFRGRNILYIYRIYGNVRNILYIYRIYGNVRNILYI